MTQSKAHELLLTLPSDTEIKLTRALDAPRELVFKAFTSCEHVSRWWGPADHVMTVCEMDFRVGGAWRYTLREPGDTEHPFKGVYREIVPRERIVYTFIYDVAPFNEGEAVETVAFAEDGGKTILTNTVAYDSRETRDGVIASGMEDGARMSMDRLDELLRTMA